MMAFFIDEMAMMFHMKGWTTVLRRARGMDIVVSRDDVIQHQR